MVLVETRLSGSVSPFTTIKPITEQYLLHLWPGTNFCSFTLEWVSVIMVNCFPSNTSLFVRCYATDKVFACIIVTLRLPKDAMPSTVGFALLKEAVKRVSFCPVLFYEHRPVIGFMKSF